MNRIGTITCQLKVARIACALLLVLGSNASAEANADANTGANTGAKANAKAELGTDAHWAFVAPSAPTIPSVRDTHWVRSPVDAFILSKLESNGLAPSPSADQRALIRRATFDLTGLPPTESEVAEFLADDSPDAFARVIDRLLNSARYGERWGRYWLDVARYADTKGYVYSDREEGRFVHSHVYRDWVVGALNRDVPYDRFLALQLAADLLGDAKDRVPDEWLATASKGPNGEPASAQANGTVAPGAVDDLAALGFLTLGRRFLGVTHDIIDDRIDVVMRGMQGLTVSCARCHDHKYDPIPTEDYYSLYGVFMGVSERTVPIGPGRLAGDGDSDEAFRKGLEERVSKLNSKFQELRHGLIKRLRDQAPRYLEAVLEADKLPTEEFYEIRGPEDLNPTIVRRWQAYLHKPDGSAREVFGPWLALEAISGAEFQSQAVEALDRLEPRARAADPPVNARVWRALREADLKSMTDVAAVYGRLLDEAHRVWMEMLKGEGQPDRSKPPSGLEDPDREALRRVLYGPGSPTDIPDGAIADLEWFFDEKGRVQLAQAQREIERWILQSPASGRYAVILQDRMEQRQPRVFIRGNPASKGAEVPRQFLQCLSGSKREPFNEGSGRLELALAIADRNNPLTARVQVNRIWAHHFGAGLVSTPSDLGTRAEPPSHPELLDWLAVWFMNQGWSQKKLHRLLMLSSVYQQDSKRSDRPESDPANRWLWKMNPVRLDFEAMRDALLAASGELDLSMGGRSADMFQAPFSKRRALYGFIDRQFLPGVLRMFDYANPDMHSPSRSDTTVPQQALFFMNSPFVVERARALAARIESNGSDAPEYRVRRLYRRLYQRDPTGEEIRAGLEFVRLAPPPPEAPRPKPSAWQYGYGELDEAMGRLKSFHPLPHFTGEAWQGGEQWPDKALGWVQLTAEGGHAGNDLQHAAIRRWVAPETGSVSIQATLRHLHPQGDGIRAFVVSSRSGVLGRWELQQDKVDTVFEGVSVEAGDTLDFVVDIRGGLNSDDFKWAPVIRRVGAEAGRVGAAMAALWDAKQEFGGTAVSEPEPLSAWEQYAQVLLLANEFVFVD